MGAPRNRTTGFEDASHLDKSISLDGAHSVQDICDMLNQPVAADVGSFEFKDYTANMAFMEEVVAVRVHPTNDPNAEPLVEVFCNGTPQRFVRGHWVPVKRKFIEVLARAKPFTVRTPEYTDSNGDRTTRMDFNTAVRYPFEVQGDTPEGSAWLNRIRNEA
jgi:hypothetical protein